eukprot:6918641-Pyramimonas_sp.AAC.1
MRVSRCGCLLFFIVVVPLATRPATHPATHPRPARDPSHASPLTPICMYGVLYAFVHIHRSIHQSEGVERSFIVPGRVAEVRFCGAD